MDELEARRRLREESGDRAAENELLGRLEANRRRRRETEDSLAAAVEEVRAARADAAALTARVEALETRLEARDAELAAARRSLAREQGRARAERRRIESEREEAAAELESLKEVLKVEQRRVRHTRELTDRLKAQAITEREELRLEAAAERDELGREMGQIADRIERTARSRSWRLGHWLMRALRRLTFRPAASREDPLLTVAEDLSRLAENRRLETGEQDD